MYNKDQMKKSIQYYANKLNLPVIPCNGKIPKLQGWQKRNKAPTSIEIEKWLDTYHEMNIGLVLGQASELVGIDVDGEKAQDLLKEWSNGDLPETWTYRTPSGGLRLLYRSPEGTPLKKVVKTLDGEHSELALMGEGQQTILPPSIYQGNQYKWLKNRNPAKQELADAPKWMVDRMLGAVKDNNTDTSKDKQKQVASIEEERKVLKRLAGQCESFKQAWKDQQQKGISEDDWHLWTRLFVQAGQTDTAQSFSELSSKHDIRSEERLEELIGKTKPNSPMVRCSSFGCSKEQIEKCHGRLNLNDDDEATNSPGTFIRDMKDEPLLPTNPIYKPYIDALEDIEDYTLDEHGRLISFDKKGNPFEVSNFVARPTLEVIRDDGQEERRTFRIEGVLNGGKPLSPIDITSKDFLSMNWYIDNWGIQTSIRPGQGRKDIFRDATQHMGISIEKQHIFTHIGWRQLENGKWVYLHANGCIGAEHISIEVEKELDRYVLPNEVRNPINAAKASLRLLKVAPKHITIPLLAVVYLSPLVEAFKQGGNEPNFVVWLHGTTGSRKTTLGQLFLSHFGKFVSKNPPASFKDTANAIERKAFSTKDTLILIDDFHPEASRYESQKMAQIAQRVLRMYGDRIGRGRLTSSIQFQKNYAPRGMAIVTGEDVPKGESSVARFIEAELQKNDVNLEELTKMQKFAPYLAEAMVGYIKWLTPQMDDLPALLEERFHNKRETFQKSAAHGRLGESAAWLIVAFDMMLSYMESIDAIKEDMAYQLLDAAEKVLIQTIQKQNSLVNQEKPEEIFINALNELFASNKVRLTPLDKGLAIEDSLVETSGEKIGWYDNHFFYLLPEATYNAVSKFLSKRGESFPVSERTLWKHLDLANMIKTEVTDDGKTHRCVKKTIPKGRMRKEEKPYRPRLVHLFSHVFDNDNS
ncbi:bifunctional DNA primase/polymerase [Metabacillus sp. B2-18]|uniref:bifunctional DNA primase/polymerase n=1 Tax=Metabacillus sp. B2-18 TaxID=2897333 RepID=UPI001E3AE041|nr:bifunctional DNA primase/polymerase [Metabacillus sp. B2-18]UGB30581.1 bifunctional DNA primase/polymerase [Metabacillus sp. B2-18]